MSQTCIIPDYPNYRIYDDGRIYNMKTKQYIKKYWRKERNAYYIRFPPKSSIHFAKLLYETFNNCKLTKYQPIIYIDNDNKNINLNNLKIKETLVLDPNKQWIDIYGYENDYMISNYGDTYSKKTNKILKSRICNSYIKIELILNNKRNIFTAHRVVFESFHKRKIKNNMVIDHIDRNRQNNHINNLREVTQKENSNNKTQNKYKHEKVLQYSLDNKLIKEWNNTNEIITFLKITHTSKITACCILQLKSAYKYIWRYKDYIYDKTGFYNIKTNNEYNYSKYKINKEGVVINNLGRIIKTSILDDYNYVALVSDTNNNRKRYLIHQLMAQTFLDNPENKLFVNHKDKCRNNNKLENLEWCTSSENNIHAQGKKVSQFDLKTKKLIKTYDSIACACRAIKKFNNDGIVNVCNGKAKKASGFFWQFHTEEA